MGIPKRILNLTILALVLLVLICVTALINAGGSTTTFLPSVWVSSLRQSEGLPQPTIPRKFVADSIILDESHSISYVVSTSYQKNPFQLRPVLHKLVSNQNNNKFSSSILPTLLEETRKNINNQEWINSHWFHEQVSRIWLEEENAFFVVHQLVYKAGSSELLDRKLQKPTLSVLYAVFETETMEIKSGFQWKGRRYPEFIPIDIGAAEKVKTDEEKTAADKEKEKDELKEIKTVGPINPKVIPFKTDEGVIQPLIVFTLETKEGSRIHWMTTGETRHWTKPKAFKLSNVENPKYESWAPFADIKGTLDALVDDAVHFVYGAGTNAIIKCQLWNSECAITQQDSSDPNKIIEEFSNGSPLVSIGSQLKLASETIEDVWIGFIGITMNKCGCGQRMDRPAFVVYQKEKGSGPRLVQLSQALDFLLPVSGWDHLAKVKEACLKVSSMKISSISVEKDGNLNVQATTSEAISFDLTIQKLIREISKGLSFDGKYTPPSTSLSLEHSKSYCLAYGKKHSSFISSFIDDKEENQKTTTPSTSEDSDDLAFEYVDTPDDDISTVELLKKGKKLVLYPSYIEKPLDHYLEHFGMLDQNKKEIAQLAKSKVKHPNPFTDFRYKNLELSIYSAFTDLKQSPKREACSKIRQDIPIKVSDGVDMTMQASRYILRYINNDPALDPEQLAYFHEYSDHFKDKIEEMKKNPKIIDKHWMRFAGASVFIEEYGVYLMASRIIYTKNKRDSPLFSLTFIEVYDENWEELNVEMVVPATDDNSIGFRKFNYPGFVRIASYNNANVDTIKNYGPEDPRILLRNNHLGHEEPVIVFNQRQRDMVKNDGDKVNLKEHRSFFMCLPWEVQEGKSEVDPLSFKETRTTYTKTIELKIFDDQAQKFLEKRDAEKNWTPFFSMDDRKLNNGVDTSIYFVYLWENIQILKCEIPTGSGTGSTVCKSVFWNKPTKKESTFLRGGTQLISLSSIVKELPEEFEKVNHEVWLGFGRSHMSHCGCGSAMYRPQLLVLAKDLTDHKYQVTHVSSFASFDLEMIPWADKMCGEGASVFIPNGIAKWHSQVVNDRLDDVLTLFYSMADKTIGRVNIRGVINELHKLGAFRLPAEVDTLDDSGTTDFFKVTSQVKCASHQSWDFCAKFGQLFTS